jgi:hypothetical protein
MCRLPVTLGGGIMMLKVSAPGFALAPALKQPASSQRRKERRSASAALNVLSIAMVATPALSA